MMRKTGEMNRPSYDWSEGIAAIKSPTLIVFADADSIRLDHMVDFYKLLGAVSATPVWTAPDDQ